MQKRKRGRRLKRKKLLGTLAAVLAVLALGGVILWDTLQKRAEPQTLTGFAMGSVLSAELYGGSDETARAVLAAAQTLDGRISRTIGNSFVARVNAQGKAETDGAFTADLQALLTLCSQTGGAFDISLGALSDLWDVEAEHPALPADADVSAALVCAGYEKIRTNGETVSVPDGMALDLGAAGKGMACDAAKTVLDADGSVSGAVISAGGSLLLYGRPPKKDAWVVGIRDPAGGANDLMGRLRVREGFVSTSGNYEKYFELDGARYCHILSPYDGWPARSGLQSVTVLAKTGMESDALSTACFVLGYEKSLPILEKSGAEAIFIFDDNAVAVTDGMRDGFEITNDDYTLK